VNTERIEEIFESFKNLKTMVIGDVMLDAYYFGNVERISPEAPVPVVSVSSKDRRLGGAANVALNLKGLGADVTICSIVGNDRDGEFLKILFEESGIDASGLITDLERPTTIKTRIIANDQQVLRVDEEDPSNISIESEIRLVSFLKEKIEHLDVIVLQDYNKGLLSPSFIKKILAACKKYGTKVVVDPKKENFLAYKGVDLFKPNRKEIIEGLKIDSFLKTRDDIQSAIQTLNQSLGAKRIMVTLSEDGTAISDLEDISFHPAHKRKVVDVSGAGDSVISVAALCIALDLEAADIAFLSNLAGGLVCERVGVVPVDKTRLFKEAVQLNN